jgi:hypothetical protein
MTATDNSHSSNATFTPALTHTMNYSTDAMRALAECQGKYAAFVSKRLAEDFAMPSRLAECRSPMEVIDVWAGFYRTAMEHYAGHARTMTELGQQALEDTVREAELEAADIVDAAASAIKAVEPAGDAAAKSDQKAA